MSAIKQITTACTVLIDEINQIEGETQDTIMVTVPAKVLLAWLPTMKQGLDSLSLSLEEFDAEAAGMTRDDVLAALDTQLGSMQKVFGIITAAITDNDQFKVFNLQGKLADAGVNVGVNLMDEDGTITKYPAGGKDQEAEE